MPEIMLDAVQAENISQTINSKKSELDGLFDKLEKLIFGLTATPVWKGEIRNAFYERLANTKKHMEAISGDLKGFIDSLNNVVEIYVKADEDLAEKNATHDSKSDAGSGGNMPPGGSTNLNSLESFKNNMLDQSNWTEDEKYKEHGGARFGIDVDGAYGAQCADLSKKWYMELTGEKEIQLSAWKEYIIGQDENGKNITEWRPEVVFSPKAGTMTNVSGGPYAAGDIGFTITKPNTGHTFVILSGPGADGTYQILEQNYPTGESPRQRTIPASEITNGYRKV